MKTINILETNTSDNLSSLYDKGSKSYQVLCSRLLKKPKIQFCLYSKKLVGTLLIEGSLDNKNWFTVKSFDLTAEDIKEIYIHNGLLRYIRAKIIRKETYTIDWFQKTFGAIEYLLVTY